MLQLYQNKCPNYAKLNELKGVVEMRSKMCSQRLQNNTKTSFPKITTVGKCTILIANEALVAFVYDQCSSTKVWKCSFATPQHQKQPTNLQRVKERNKNKTMTSKLVSTHSLKWIGSKLSSSQRWKEGKLIENTQAKILHQYPPPKVLPYHGNHSKLHGIIKQPKIERQVYEPMKGESKKS